MIKTLSLKDREGAMHQYIVKPHPTKEGQPLVMSLMVMLAEPGMALLKAMMEAGDSADQEDLMNTLDFSTLGPQLKSALLGLDPNVITQFFHHTLRDGKDMSRSANYDEAYGEQANWGEWLEAIYEIVQVNGWIPFLATSGTSLLKAQPEVTTSEPSNVINNTLNTAYPTS